jgi:hypothetical protein
MGAFNNAGNTHVMVHISSGNCCESAYSWYASVSNISLTVNYIEGWSISVSAPPGDILAGSTKSAYATVSGFSNTAVTWSISPPGAGTLTTVAFNTVVYTAPAAIDPIVIAVTLTATSVTDSSKSGSVTFGVARNDPASVTVSPGSVTLSQGADAAVFGKRSEPGDADRNVVANPTGGIPQRHGFVHRAGVDHDATDGHHSSYEYREWREWHSDGDADASSRGER